MAGFTGGARRLAKAALAVLTAAALVGASACDASAAGAGGPVHWTTPRLVDTGAPFSSPAQPQAVACPTSSTCLAVGSAGTVISTTAGVSTISRGVDGGSNLGSIACPSANLCVVTTVTALLTSTEPTAPHPSWQKVRFHLGGDEFQDVVCATASLCVASDDSTTLRISTDPTGPASAWKPTAPAGLSGEFSAITCAPQSTFCVISGTTSGGDTRGFLTTSDPSGGAAAWRATGGSSLEGLGMITCPSADLCVGAGPDDATLETSSDPAAGASSWTGGTLPGGLASTITGIRCLPAAPPASSAPCVATLAGGAIATSEDPAGGIATWTISGVLDPAGFSAAGFGVDGLACPTTTVCVAPDQSPGLATVSLDPPASAAAATDLGGTTGLTALSCPSAGFCVAVDRTGSALTSTAPRGPAADWTRQAISGVTAGLAAVDCPTTAFCVAVGAHDAVATSSDPAVVGGWRETTLSDRGISGGIDQLDDLQAVACPSVALCVIGDSGQGLLISTDPSGAPGVWRHDAVAFASAYDFSAVACASVRLCIAGDLDGRVAVSTDPAGTDHAWRLLRALASPAGQRRGPIDAASCPSARLCLIGTDYGAIYWSTHPAAGRGSWHRVSLTSGSIRAIACSSARRCVASGRRDQLFSTTDPAGGRHAWHAVRLDTGAPDVGTVADRNLATVACAPQTFCLAATGIGALSVGMPDPSATG